MFEDTAFFLIGNEASELRMKNDAELNAGTFHSNLKEYTELKLSLILDKIDIVFKEKCI